MLRLEVTTNRCLYNLWTKLLARKNIQIHIIGLFYKVSDDIGSLYQLHQSKPCLSARSKMFHPWRTVGYHVNLLNQLIRELDDLLAGADGASTAGARVDNKMMTPCHY